MLRGNGQYLTTITLPGQMGRFDQLCIVRGNKLLEDLGGDDRGRGIPSAVLDEVELCAFHGLNEAPLSVQQDSQE
ncbi:hypothetical protein ES703_53903 [subsurface metagenome]